MDETDGHGHGRSGVCCHQAFLHRFGYRIPSEKMEGHEWSGYSVQSELEQDDKKGIRRLDMNQNVTRRGIRRATVEGTLLYSWLL
ncbi:hypothetical protein LINPERHAP2_LOCUS3602 [Linum perenne]